MVTLVCVAKDFYPDHVSLTWMVGGKPPDKGVATDPYATQDKSTKLYSISSRLKVTKKQWNNAKNKFSCKFTFLNETGSFDIEKKVSGIGGMQ